MMIVLGWNQNISFQIIMRYTSGGDPIQKMWDRNKKIAADSSCRKRKLTGFIYLHGSKCCEAEGFSWWGHV